MTTTARTAFVNGLVWTDGFAAPRPLDVLVEGDTIAAVSNRGELDATDATVIDLQGRVLSPGFQDAHLHLEGGGGDLLACELSEATSAEDVLARIKAFADSHPDDAWITGAGWQRDFFEQGSPTAELLDSVTGERPAALYPFDHHGVWLNSAALKLAGITVDTPDPEHGRLSRLPDGSPAGMLEEAAAALVAPFLPTKTEEEQIEGVHAGQSHLLSKGITSCQDALVGPGMGMRDQFDVYVRMLAESTLDVRLTTALWWNHARGLEQLEELKERRRVLQETAGADRVVADTVKIMIDGAGLLYFNPEQLREVTVACDAAGFNCHYHSYAELTTRWALDAIEEAITTNPLRNRRHHIAHLFVVAGEDFKRFADLGVTANVQGFWAGTPVPHEHMKEVTVTTDPEDREYPFGRMEASGVRLAAGSDWPVTTCDPFLAIGSTAGYLPEPRMRKEIPEKDRLDVVSMFKAFTTGSAFVNGRAASTGRIAPGYLADLVVLSQDPFGGRDALLGTSVDETWVGGRKLYTRD
ncbi:MAG: amidohydrolase [Galactobacter sp.]